MDTNHFLENYGFLIPLLSILFVWELVWKLIALWKAGRNNQLAWFIVIALVNTVGILPIIYLIIQKKKSDTK